MKVYILKHKYNILAYVLAFFMVIGVLSLCYIPAHADDKTSENGSSIFIKPIIHGNQVPHKGFFDQIIAPGQTSNQELEIQNVSSTSQSVNLTVAPAQTNSAGTLIYDTQNQQPLDSSLQYNMRDYATTAPIVVVAAHKTVHVPLTLHMPNVVFNGVILGGIIATQVNQGNSNSTLGSKINTTIMIAMRQNINNLPAGELKLVGNVKMQLGTTSRTIMLATVQNDVANLINDVEVNTHITGPHNINLTWKSQGRQIAPNSHMAMEIPLTLDGNPIGETIKLYPGVYHVNISLTSHADNRTWNFSQDVHSTDVQLNNLHHKDISFVTAKHTGSTIQFYIIAVIVIILIIVGYLIYKKTNKYTPLDEIK